MGRPVLAVIAPINDTRFLGQWISHVKKYADAVFVYDDRTSGEVTNRLKNEPLVKHIHTNHTKPFNESVIRNGLYMKAFEYNIDWVLLLDVDEKMDDRFVGDVHELVNNEQAAAFTEPWYNFWEGEERVRTDGRWMAEFRRRIKLMRVYDIKPWKSGRVQYSPNGFVIPDGRKIIDDKIHKCLHYGFIDQSIRDRKREVWKDAPPSLKIGWDDSDKPDGDRITTMNFIMEETHEEFLLRRKKQS